MLGKLGGKFVNLGLESGRASHSHAVARLVTVMKRYFAMHNLLVRFPIACVIAAMVTSCGNGSHGGVSEPGVLVKIGDSRLTVSELSEAMPYGLAGADSAAWCRSYIDNWIERKAVGLEAARNIADTRRIDRMAEEYRNDLLMLEYRKVMAEQQESPEYSDDSLRREYDRQPGLYRCSQPMIRGIFLSVDKKHPHINDLRRWSRSSAAADLEKLEKESLDPAVEYLYFRDRWLPWSDIEARVPDGIGAEPGKSLARHPGFETTVGDRVYMLAVNDHLSAGDQMPFELARDAVAGMLQSASAADYDLRLRRELVKRAYDNGQVKLSTELAGKVGMSPDNK